MTNELLAQFRAEQFEQARTACAHLGSALNSIGVALPGLKVEQTASGDCRLVLGNLDIGPGKRLAFAVLAGAPVLHAIKAVPNADELLVDTATGRLGRFRGVEGELWRLAGAFGNGEPWTADPLKVREPTVNERVRTHMAAVIGEEGISGAALGLP
ncbi:hypothetical protein ACIQF6_01075 [Kitasatospora sp. NPDC092948]|uniref:hypothetical protein n=1 Tax=Kitasatospora sp. NPDC092948 TaxID=3364088 RepID=UPI0037F447A5